jgi:hypothetical protein
MQKSVILLHLLIFSTAVTQAQDMVFPAIQGYVGVIPIPFETEKPDPTRHYKFMLAAL